MTDTAWPSVVIDWQDVAVRLQDRRNHLVLSGAAPAELAVIDDHIAHLDRRLVEMSAYDRGPAPRM